MELFKLKPNLPTFTVLFFSLFLFASCQEDEDPEVSPPDTCCVENLNRNITVNAVSLPDEIPLKGYLVETWGIDVNGDIFLGYGTTDMDGNVTFEITEAVFDKVFNNSPSIYHKMYLQEELLSSTRDVSMPEYDPNIRMNITDMQYVQECN